MRFLDEIEGKPQVERFVAYLMTEGIDSHLELARADSDTWEVWIREEDRLEQAQAELDVFRAAQNDRKYQDALDEAQSILATREKARKEAAKNQRKMRQTGRAGVLGQGRIPPLTMTLLILCVAVGLFTSFGTPRANNRFAITVLNQLSFLSFEDSREFPDDAAASLKQGEVWRVITPIFIHHGMLHLALNMFMLVSFGRVVERWVGTPYFAIMVVVLAILPNLLQGLAPEWMHGNPAFGGISGVLFGLFGYVWVRSSMNPMLGISIPFPMAIILIALIVIGLSGVVPNWPFADLCHLGGLLVGAALGFASEQANQ